MINIKWSDNVPVEKQQKIINQINKENSMSIKSLKNLVRNKKPTKYPKILDIKIDPYNNTVSRKIYYEIKPQKKYNIWKTASLIVTIPLSQYWQEYPKLYLQSNTSLIMELCYKKNREIEQKAHNIYMKAQTHDELLETLKVYSFIKDNPLSINAIKIIQKGF